MLNWDHDIFPIAELTRSLIIWIEPQLQGRYLTVRLFSALLRCNTDVAQALAHPDLAAPGTSDDDRRYGVEILAKIGCFPA